MSNTTTIARPAGPTGSARASFGALLREWRLRRRLSQLDLAGDADVSTRHLSFVETGRATPSREMVLRLAARLDVPLRERNRLLTAAGYAPMYAERPLDDPALASARAAVELVLRGHEPYPALAVDRHWSLVSYNRAVLPLLAGAAPELLQPPINVLRLSLHPRGLAPRIANLGAWRGHLLARLHQQVAASADPVLAALEAELRGYGAPDGAPDGAADADPSAAPNADPNAHGDGPADEPLGAAVVVPLQLRTAAGTLSLISTTTVFGTPVDVTLSELALETFFPADEATGAALRAAWPPAG